jgi:hypothetical protein
MQHLVWLCALLCLVAIVASLGSALWHLSHSGPGDADKLARALTVRISLSVALFLMLMLAWHFGLITPHPLLATPPHG